MNAFDGFLSNNKTICLIAEAGTAHNNSLERAVDLVDAAAQSKADIIKFQHVLADELFVRPKQAPPSTSKQQKLYEQFKALEVDKTFWEQVAERCHQKNIGFLCSVFGRRSLEDLRSIGAFGYKIASPESNHYSLWNDLLTDNKPVFFSTGLTTKKDLQHLRQTLTELGAATKNLLMMHCVSEYPAQPEAYNLRLLANMKQQYGLQIGLSDHTKNPFCIPLLACAVTAFLGEAFCLEKHFCLDRNKGDLDDEVAVTPSELANMRTQLEQTTKTFSRMQGNDWGALAKALQERFPEWRKSIPTILGSGEKQPTPGEQRHYKPTNRTLHATQNIAKGERITEENAGYYRSFLPLGGGLSHEHWESFRLSRMKATKNIDAGEPITPANAPV